MPEREDKIGLSDLLHQQCCWLAGLWGLGENNPPRKTKHFFLPNVDHSRFTFLAEV